MNISTSVWDKLSIEVSNITYVKEQFKICWFEDSAISLLKYRINHSQKAQFFKYVSKHTSKKSNMSQQARKYKQYCKTVKNILFKWRVHALQSAEKQFYIFQ